MLLLSSMISAFLFIGGFEAVRNIQYHRWKAHFDNFGWFGRITMPSPDPVLMWEYRPYGRIGLIKTNRHGFRDRDYDSVTKPAGAFRVAFAGDSVTLGIDMQLKQTFVRQFEVAANRNDPQRRVQALNFGVDGYNAPQILQMIRTKALAFSPDEVVYVMCLNDFDFEQSSGEKILYFRKPRSFFLSALEEAYQKLRGGDFHQYHYDRNKEIVLQSVLDMRKLVEGRGHRFQVVVLPIFPATFDDYPLREMHREIDAFLGQSGIRYLDLLEPFVRSGRRPRFWAYDVWHPNANGHRFIAQHLLGAVLQETSVAPTGAR